MFSVDRVDERGRSRGAPPQSGWVLPRPLRKPARFLGRLAQGDVTFPRFTALTLSAAYLAGSTVYGAVLGGYMPGVAQAVTARTGFAVNEIAVTGNKEVSEIDVLDQLELTGWTSLVGFDASAARDRIARLAWVQNASVRKVYPDKIEVDLVERKPFAVWQHDGKLSVVEAGGAIIASASSTRGLPMIVGAGAPEAGQALLAKMADYPALANKVTSYVRVSNRRWDLKLFNGVTVKLPEEGAGAALSRLAEADAAQQLLSRDIVSVDMRIDDRIVLALSETAKMPAAPVKAKGRT